MRSTRRAIPHAIARAALMVTGLLVGALPASLSGQAGTPHPQSDAGYSGEEYFIRAAAGAALGIAVGFGAGAVACSLRDCRPATRANVRAAASLLGGVAGAAGALGSADAANTSFGGMLVWSIVGGALASGVAVGSVLLLEERAPVAVQGFAWTISFSITHAAVLTLFR